MLKMQTIWQDANIWNWNSPKDSFRLPETLQKKLNRRTPKCF